MILSRARDALQTPVDTRFQWKGQGRGLKNTHKSHFAFPRLPEVVKIKGCKGHLIEQRERRHRTESKSVGLKFYFQNKPDDHRR